MQNFNIPELSINKNPPVGYHFAVIFFAGGLIPSPLDMQFQKVSGLSSEIETSSFKEGGENLYVHRLPNRVTYGNLTLERGLVTGSPLNIDFNHTMSTMKISPGNVLVSLLNEESIPVSAWLFWKTYPVKWSVSDLDATRNSLVIDTMELAYTRFQSLRV